MKNSHANYIRYALQYTRLPDLRYMDTRIYPNPEMYNLILQGICLCYRTGYEIAQKKKNWRVYLYQNLRNTAMILFGYLNIFM